MRTLQMFVQRAYARLPRDGPSATIFVVGRAIHIADGATDSSVLRRPAPSPMHREMFRPHTSQG